VDKKIILAAIIVIIIFIASISYVSLGNDQDIESDESYASSNLLPKAVVSALETAYFGEKIIFDASESYDEDGAISSFTWDFGDEETSDGATVEHVYNFDNNFSIEYPLIYSVLLIVRDDTGFWNSTLHQIKLFPKQYKFYLNNAKLSIEKPSSNKESVKASFGKITSLQEISYEFNHPILIQECSWNATIYIQKPRFAFLRSISLALYDNNESKISGGDISFGLFDFWKEKTVLFKGEINRPEKFKSAKLVIYGFTFGKKINILYGDDKASQICFDFT